MGNYDYSYIYGLLASLGLIAFFVPLVVYVISSLLWYKFFKKVGLWYADNAWMAWVPVVNNYIIGKYLQEQNALPEYHRYILGLYPLVSFIPIIGGIASFAGAVYFIYNEFKYMQRNNEPTIDFVCIFIFPIIIPYLWGKAIPAQGKSFYNDQY